MDIWTLYELSWLNMKGLSQVTVGHAEFDYTDVNPIKSKGSRLYLNSFDQTRFNNWDEMRQTLERDLGICAQGKISVVLYRLDELEGQPTGHLSGTYIDGRDITIDNYELTTGYLGNATSGEKVMEETFVNHLLKSSCLITHQPDWGSIQIQYRGRRVDREKLLRHLVSFRHHNKFHEQYAERTFNDLLRFCQPEKLSVYVRYTHRGGLDINPWRDNSDFVLSTIRLARQQVFSQPCVLDSRRGL